jgi:phosphoglucosamine mutase
LPSPTGALVGVREEASTAFSDYLAFLRSTVDGLDLSGVKVAVDCANGAAYKIAPDTLKALGAEILPIHNTPNGVNINDHCGSTHIESLAAYVTAHGADIGLALDGDGDRLLCVDERGAVLDGDQIMSICAEDMKNAGRLKKNTIVATVMSNMGLFMLEQKGFHIEQTAVGDRAVLENMVANGYSLGGEQSGHIIFLDYNTTGDGMLTALQLLRVMKKRGAPLSAINSVMEKMPQALVSAKVSNEKKSCTLKNETIRQEIHKLEEKYAGAGRVFIRPSGTEPVIRVMIEGQNADEIQKDAQRVAMLMESICL